MPELDGTSIIAILAFASLVLAWLMAPTSSVAVADGKALPAAAAA